MAKRESIFGDEWRRCLREHYKYVVRQEDKLTEATLLPILDRFGIRDDELRQLYLEATMRDMPDDFVPDMEKVLAQSAGKSVAETRFQTHPAECKCPACMDTVLDAGHDSVGQPVEEPEEPEVAQGNMFAVAKPEKDEKDDLPKQKSLF
jgi:hypothetical protein